jgi:hypothetical protein
MNRFLIGVDFGTVNDYTALVIAEELVWWEHKWQSAIDLQLGSEEIDYATLSYEHMVMDLGEEAEVPLPPYHVRHIQRWRLGTRYTSIAKDIRKLWYTSPLVGQSQLVVDNTGVGVPISDMIMDLVPIRVTITGGNTPNRGVHGYNVPKRDIVSSLVVVLQSDRLKISSGLSLASTLVGELQDFRLKMTESGKDTYEAWKSSAHDDIVLALGIAIWYRERLLRH